MDRFFRASCLLLLMLFSFIVKGQDQTDQNWWFGNGTRGIQFTQPGDTARLILRNNSAVSGYGNGGGAVANDPSSGGLLFYTDGSVVYDATHRPMPNGTGLGGNPASSNPAVIVQIPGQTSRYFIITNNAGFGSPGQLFSSEVDMTLFGNSTTLGKPPFGDVTGTKAAPIANLSGQSQAMIVIRDASGVDSWLITHAAGTDGFHVTPVTSTGIAAPATTTGAGAGFGFSASSMAWHPASQRLAVAPSGPNQNVMIYSFDDENGTLTFDRFVFNSAVTTSPLTASAISDVEWSNDGAFLYVSRTGDNGVTADVLQFDLANQNITPASVLTQPISRSFGLQIAPDSSVYHIYQASAGGPFLVGRISDPDTVATAVNYNAALFNAHNFNATQFPTFMARTRQTVTLDFNVSGTCANAPTSFFPIVSPAADSLQWEFGDGNSASAWSPTHTYEQGQTYDVTLRAFLNGDTTLFTKPVNITQFDLQISLVQDTTACSCELLFPKANPAPPPCTPFALTATVQGSAGAVQWYGPSGALAGQTSLTLSPVDSAGFYYVTVQDPAGSGCVAYAGVNIREYGIPDPRSNIWYFGNNAGINFNQDFRPATGADAIQGDITSPEGVAVICDANGQIVLSTDGNQVFDREGTPLVLDPPGFGGNPGATQSALIIPVASDPTLFYIFTTQEIYNSNGRYELRYAIFDLKRGANGEVVDPDNDPSNGVSTVLFSNSTERITGNENWLIAHEYGTNNFRAYRITADGISAPVVSSAGSVHSLDVPENGQGYMKLSPNNILAVAVSTPGVSNVVEIFDFADSTGAVTNFRTVDLEQTGGRVYGIEFAPSGTKMYASTNGGVNALHEFAYDSAAGTYIKKPTIPVNTPSQEIGAIQRGPDGNIYVAVNGATSLGTISPNPDVDQPSTFTQNGFPLLAGTSSTLGLPNFIQNINDATQTPSISVTGLCLGSPSQFTGSGTDPIDTLTWFFGDGSSVRGANLTETEHTYSAPGTYTVTLRISNRCVGFVQDLVETVTINPIPQIAASAAALCTGDEIIEAVPDNDPQLPLTFAWSTGETTRTIQPRRPGFFRVTVTNAAGCSADTTHFLSDNRPQIDLGPDQTLCQNSGNFTLDANNPGSLYEWQLNGVVVGTAQRQTVSTGTASPPTFQYILTVTDPFTNCIAKDTVSYTINRQPQYTPTGTNPTGACGNANGEIAIQVTSTGNFAYFITGPQTANGLVTGPGNATATGLRSGAYNVNVQDQVTGCTNDVTVGLSDDASPITAVLSKPFQCNDADRRMPVDITVSGIAANLPYSYRLLVASTTGQSANGNGASPGDPFTTRTIPVPNATYVAEVTSGLCVEVSAPLAIQADNPIIIDDIAVNPCAPTATITVSSDAPGTGATYAWTGPNLLVANQAQASISPIPSGSQNYILNISAPSRCPADTTVNVNFAPDPQATLTQNDACQNQVTLSANPSGNYVYRWFRAGTQFSGGQQVIANLTDSGVTYQVDVRNTTTGCFTSATQTVAVIGELTVDLTNPQPCEGADFTLTATPNQVPDLFAWTFNRNAIANASTNTYTISRASASNNGSYRVTVSRTSGGFTCIARDSVQVNVAPVTAGLLTDNGIICPDPANPDPNTRERVLDPGPGFSTFDWFKDGVSLGVNTPTYTATEIGSYSVDLVNVYGCPSSDRITLIEECDPRITGPNAFRPSGLNREFFVYTFFIADTDFEVFIFNRWGEMVFYSDRRDFRWNGGYNNNAAQPAPPGTYSYLIKYKSSYREEEGIQEFRSGVVLIR